MLLAWFALLLAGPAQDLLPPEVLLLSRIERHMKERLAHLPDYTCLETVQRFSGASRMDTVQLEVAHVGDEELYAWPGGRAFENDDSSKLVGFGTMSTGEFASHLSSVFLGGATIRYHGEEGGLHRYDFAVPLLFSRWRIQVAGQQGDAASRGSFWADPDSLEVVRLEVEADGIPPNVRLARVRSRIDYAPVRIGASAVWLPQSADVLLVDFVGSEKRNHIEFSHCRQYSGTSEVSFEETAPKPASPRGAPAEIAIAPGIAIPAQLLTEIDSAKARVGDPITATVTAAAPINKRERIPKGALLHGRLRWLQKFEKPTEYFLVGLEFSEVEFDGRRGQFYAKLERIGPVAGLEYLLSDSRVSLHQHHEYTTYTSRAENLRPPDLPGIATFFMRGRAFRLPAGVPMLWRTVDAKR